jgi:hypothetical protein
MGNCLLIIVTAIMESFRNKYRLRDVLSNQLLMPIARSRPSRLSSRVKALAVALHQTSCFE